MKNIAVVSFTKVGMVMMEEMVEVLQKHYFECVSFGANKNACDVELVTNLKETSIWIGEHWKEVDAFLFIGGVDVSLQMMIPHLENKVNDPAVLVMDEARKYIIPVLGNYVAGGNNLAIKLSIILEREAVLTTPIEVAAKFDIEKFAAKNGMEIGSKEQAKIVTAAILEGQKVGLYSEYPIEGIPPMGITICNDKKELQWFKHRLSVRNEYVVGMGLKQGVLYENVEKLFLGELEKLEIDVIQIKELATMVDYKEEPALLELAAKFNIPIVSFTNKELRDVPNNTVGESTYVGEANISERSAFLGSGYGEIVQPKIAGRGATFAVAKKPKVIYF